MESRRDVLRMGAGVTGVGLLTSIAGCSSIPFVGGGLDYADWMYDPDSLDQQGVSITQIDVEALLDADGISSEERDNLAEELESDFDGAVAAEDINSVVAIGNTEVATGSFDEADIADEMDRTEDDEYEGFTIYIHDDADEDGVMAIDGEYLLETSIRSFVDHDAREELELVIDTYNGDADRLVDTNDEFELLVDELGSGTVLSVSARTGSAADDVEDGEAVSSGFEIEFDGDDVSFKAVEVFRDEDEIDIDEIEAEAEEEAEHDEDVELQDVSQNGRAVIIEYTLPADEFEF